MATPEQSRPLLRRIRDRLRRPEAPPAAPEPDPFVPWEEHDELRRETDARAAEDARRHGDDLVDRPLPFGNQVEAQAVTRLERLAAHREARLAPQRRAAEGAERLIAHLHESLSAAGAVLEAHGVPPEQHAAPLRRDRWWRAVGRSIGLAFGLPSAIAEDARRRFERTRVALMNAEVSFDDARAAARAIEAASEVVAQAEAALARELVERYRASLVAHLPPEALADGAMICPHPIDVSVPEWERAA